MQIVLACYIFRFPVCRAYSNVDLISTSRRGMRVLTYNVLLLQMLLFSRPRIRSSFLVFVSPMALCCFECV